MKKKLIILGAGGNCLEIVDAVRAHRDTPYEVVGFLDDSPALQKTQIMDLPVLGPLAEAASYADCFFVNGIGSPVRFVIRQQILRRLSLPSARFATVVHPKAEVASTAQLNAGCVVLANSTVGANVRVEAHVIVLSGSSIGHDSVVGPHAILASGVNLCGGVRLENNCYIGAGAVVRGGVRIGEKSLVGAGSVVISDVSPRTVVCGNPARFLRALEDE